MTTDELQAVTEIETVISRLLRMVDDRDWTGLPSVFTEQVQVDYTSLWGGEPETLHRDALIGRWRDLLSGLDATQHLGGNVLAEIDADGHGASAVSNVIGVHRLTNPTGGPLWTVGGTYHTRLFRTGDGWAISSLTLRVAWTEGNTNIMTLAAGAKE